MPEPAPQLYLRIGSHAEKQYILKTVKLFDGALVGANLLESTPGATVSLAVTILGGFKKAFAIDPMTYTFGMALEHIQSETIDRTARKPGTRKVGLKRSFVRLLEEYGDPLESTVVSKKRPVTPDDFTDSDIQTLSSRLFVYQTERMKSEWESDPQLKELAPEMPLPTFVFAPYFYVPYDGRSNRWRRWHELNVSFAKSFASINSAIPRHAVLCVNRELLGSANDAKQVCEAYINSGSAACWLWISALQEPEITESELRLLVDLCKMFKTARVDLYNMHGGYLSALLSKHGMTGFSHGVGYGEAKDVVPVIGVTVPTVNYHLPPLHVRVPVLELERALEKLGIKNATDFHRDICDCTVCKGVLSGDLRNLHEFGDLVLKVGNIRESQTPDSAKKCRFHFLLARKKEIDGITGISLETAKQKLADSYAKFVRLPSYLALKDRAIHLPTWINCI